MISRTERARPMTATHGVRIVSADELREKLGFVDLIEPVSRAFQESSAGLADNGLIVMFPAARQEDGDVYVKTGTLRDHSVFIVKIAPWFAANANECLPQGGFVGVFDSKTGHTRAVFEDEHYLSDIRTAAAGGLSARILAPQQIETAAVLGAGTQAYWQSLALYHERPFKRLLLWARDPDRAHGLIDRLSGVLPGIDMQVVSTPETAVRNADVILTATLAREPIVKGEWLRPGQHITAVGADDPTKCELDATALRIARVFVDCRRTAAGNGDVHRAISAGAYSIDDVAGEIGQVLSGSVAGRTSDDDITIAKLVGIGAQDVATAETVIERLGLLASAR
jgi:ornithine cyclodeaminase/alanine dehydrogenase-like protein (mu-crystallin family)